jgi:hypothetical protein
MRPPASSRVIEGRVPVNTNVFPASGRPSLRAAAFWLSGWMTGKMQDDEIRMTKICPSASLILRRHHF